MWITVWHKMKDRKKSSGGFYVSEVLIISVACFFMFVKSAFGKDEFTHTIR